MGAGQYLAQSRSRSPHGERGLKLNNEVCGYQQLEVALLMESVD